MGLDAGTVLGGRVTLVVVPVVVGVLRVQAVHIIVAVGLGKNRCSGNVHQFAVALDHGLVRGVAVGFELVAIDHHVLGAYLQSVEGAVHGENRGVEDVDLVDLLGGDDAERPGESIAFDIFAQGIALLLGELLRVVEQGVRVVGREYHRCGIHIAGQASAASLIATRFDKFGMEARFQWSIHHSEFRSS